MKHKIVHVSRCDHIVHEFLMKANEILSVRGEFNQEQKKHKVFNPQIYFELIFGVRTKQNFASPCHCPSIWFYEGKMTPRIFAKQTLKETKNLQTNFRNNISIRIHMGDKTETFGA